MQTASIAPIAITPGEPAGIGPEIVLRLAQQSLSVPIVAIADTQLLRQRAIECNIDIEIISYNPNSQYINNKAGILNVLNVTLKEKSVCGQLNAANADYVLETLRIASQQCLKGTFHALVTGPIHKGIINTAGHAFSGHTEYLSDLTDGDPVMMLVADTLRVALVTTHLPLSNVSQAITASKLEKVIRILHSDLSNLYTINDPSILVAGLNPHAGEQGHMGREEIEVIEPVLKMLQDEGMRLKGPLPADTLFTPPFLSQCDAVLAMYHDQGLPVLKHIGFGHAVNVTLGLPIIRTSVDHGTALELAGTGKANIDSLRAAYSMAINLNKKKS